MLVSKAIARIQLQLGFRSDLASQIRTSLQEAQSTFEGGIELPSGGIFLPWFLRTERSSIPTVAGEERVQVPTDFLREWEDDALWFFDSTADSDEQWTALAKEDIEFARGKWPGTGAPQGYALSNRYFRIFPTPDDVYTLKMIYYGQDTAIDDAADGENKWLKYCPRLLIGEAGEQIASASRDTQGAVQYFQTMRQREIQRLWAAGEAQEHENRSYVMGGDD